MYEQRQNFTLHRCHSCGRLITYRFAICSDCEEIYGKSSLEWPTWLRDSWALEQRWRRRENNDKQYEVLFTDLYPPIEEQQMWYNNEDTILDMIVIRDEIMKLSEQDRLILGLRSMGFVQSEVARIMETSRTTVGTRIQVMREKLKRKGLL